MVFPATRPFDQGLGGKWHLAKRAFKKGHQHRKPMH
jgi:hypothetical protein